MIEYKYYESCTKKLLYVFERFNKKCSRYRFCKSNAKLASSFTDIIMLMCDFRTWLATDSDLVELTPPHQTSNQNLNFKFYLFIYLFCFHEFVEASTVVFDVRGSFFVRLTWENDGLAFGPVMGPSIKPSNYYSTSEASNPPLKLTFTGKQSYPSQESCKVCNWPQSAPSACAEPP